MATFRQSRFSWAAGQKRRRMLLAMSGGVDDASWRAGWDLKVFGYLALTRFYLTTMKAKGRG